jgi:glycosyltransferase involved in cell wall biosynthesis
MPNITTVIPLYNKAPYIKRALESVLAQTIPPLEIVVVDDGSTDDGAAIVSSIKDPRIRLIRQENQGKGAARNRGIDSAQGNLIAFLDADDAWKPRFLEVIKKLQENYPEAGAYGTAYEIITPEGSKHFLKFGVFDRELKEGLIPNYIKVGLSGFFGMAHPICASSVTVPKKIFKVIGGFHEKVPYREDLDTFLRIALLFPIAWSTESLAIWYQNASNRHFNIRAKTEPPISRTIRLALQSDQISFDMKQDLKEYGARFQLNAARDCLVQGKRDTALQLLGYARGTKLFAREWWWWSILAALPGKSAHYLWKLKKVIQRQ